MSGADRTLYLPLYGKALVSRRDILLQDPWAESIWAKEAFPLKGKARSCWLAYYLAMRAAVFDGWLQTQMSQHPQAVVLHLGCGLDSRCHRVGLHGHPWYDMDQPQVIAQREKYFPSADDYHLLSGDLRQRDWLQCLPKGGMALVVMEGVSMYLSPQELAALLAALKQHFDSLHLLMDAYSIFAAKVSKHKNPINNVGVTQVWGLDDPSTLPLTFVAEHVMTPPEMIAQLRGWEQTIFKYLYAGRLAQKMYRVREFCT